MSSRPRQRDVIQFIKENPDKILYDTKGRVYGFLEDDNPVKEALYQSRDFDPQGMIVLWVFLPYHKAGVYSGRNEYIDTFDDLAYFPIADTPINLYRPGTKEIVLHGTVYQYPERIKKNDKTAIIVLVKGPDPKPKETEK